MNSNQPPRLHTADSEPASTTPDTDWFARLRSGEVTTETDSDFCQWLEQSADNELEFERCELIWELCDELADDAEIQASIQECEDLVAEKSTKKADSRQHFLSSWISKAAALAVVGVISLLVATQLGGERYQTALGEQRLVRLEDGSTVNLNTDTEIVINFSDQRRKVELVRGEALFSVYHDPKRPFEVFAAEGVARAIGTSFNVALNGERITVSVLEGIVEVNADHDQKVSDQPLPRLEAGKAINYWRNGTIAEVSSADLKRIEAWREGKLDFDGTRLADVIQEHNRYTERRIVIGDDGLKSLLVSGVFRVNDTESLLFALEQTFGIRAQDRGDYILLSPKK